MLAPDPSSTGAPSDARPDIRILETPTGDIQRTTGLPTSPCGNPDDPDDRVPAEFVLDAVVATASVDAPTAGGTSGSTPLPLSAPLPAPPPAPAPAQTAMSMGGSACGGGPQHPSNGPHAYLQGESTAASIAGGSHRGPTSDGHVGGTATNPGARPD